MVINNATAARMQVIAHRIGNITIAAAKAVQIELLKTKMANGIAHFAFMKKDGTIREAFGTTQTNIASAKTNGNGISRECYNTTAYFDIEKGEWRSFRWENLVWVA
ncbi:MAG: DUF2693 domain-containing protein [Paludibacteraceae bacterium]|nr:DUF2693 domain-containing protein [Paludibacteraceae bacterium]